MSAAVTILERAKAVGVTLWGEGETLRYRGGKVAVESLLPMLKAHKPELLMALAQPANLDAILVEACQDVPGIDPATFLALLSPQDLENIEGGYIPVITLNAYARSFAEGIRVGRIKVLPPQAALTSRVRCGECLHFERDTIGDGAGIGVCKIGGEGTGPRHPALWPNAERECKDFEASITLPETL